MLGLLIILQYTEFRMQAYVFRHIIYVATLIIQLEQKFQAPCHSCQVLKAELEDTGTLGEGISEFKNRSCKFAQSTRCKLSWISRNFLHNCVVLILVFIHFFPRTLKALRKMFFELQLNYLKMMTNQWPPRISCPLFAFCGITVMLLMLMQVKFLIH